MRAALAFGLAYALALGASAAPSTYVISHHGRLLDGSDQPVSGEHTLAFSFFANPSAVAGETAAWTESYDVTVTDGLYAVDIGGPGHQALPATVFGQEPTYLEIAVDGTPLAPRLRVGAVPLAGVALGLDCAGCVTKAALAFDPDLVAPDAVGTPQLQDAAVTSSKLADGAVVDRTIASGIDGAKLLEGSVGDAQLGSGLDGAKLLAGSVGNDELATGLDGAKLAAGSVTNDALAAGIDGAKLADASVHDAALAGGLDGAKLAAGTVGNAQLGSGLDGAKLAPGTVGNVQLASGLDGAKLLAGSVTNDALADGIDGAKISAGSIGNAQLGTGLDGAKIAAGSIGNAQLASDLDGSKLVGGSVGNAQLASGLDGAKLAAGSVPATALALAGKSCAPGMVVRGLDADGNFVCDAGTPQPTLVQRLANLAVRGVGSVPVSTWSNVPGFILPFTAGGGPVEVNLEIPLENGSHSACRSLIDGNPAALYDGADTTYPWQEGLTYTKGWWRDWNTQHLFPNVPAGPHTLTVQCFADSSGTGLGNSSMTEFASVIPYGPAATDEVKAATQTILAGQSVPCCSFNPVSGLSVPFTAQGGLVRIALSLPLEGGSGSHASCRPLVDGTPAGQGDIDETTYQWQEGIVYVGDGGWNMWNRTRLYTNIAAGNHTATVECDTNTSPGVLSIGNGSMPATLSVVTYKPASDTSATVHAFRGVERRQYTIPAASGFVTLNASSAGTGLNGLAFKSNGGPVEIGVSLPLENGSHSTCRPLVDGSPVSSGEPDNTGYIWQDGLTYTLPGWEQWDQARLYQHIPSGDHTVSVQCATDGGTLSAGHPDMVSTVWVVAYDK